MLVEGNWVGIGGWVLGVRFEASVQGSTFRLKTVNPKRSQPPFPQSPTPNPFPDPYFTGSTNNSADNRWALNGMSIPLVVKSLPLTVICTPVSTSVTRYIPVDLSFGKVTC